MSDNLKIRKKNCLESIERWGHKKGQRNKEKQRETKRNKERQRKTNKDKERQRET